MSTKSAHGLQGTRWYIRALQLSPLLGAAMLAFVWLSVPTGLRTSLDTMREYQRMADGVTEARDTFELPTESDIAERYFQNGALTTYGPNAESNLSDRFLTMSKKVLTATAADHAQLFDATGTPVTPKWPADGIRFKDATDYEKEFDAEVSIYFIPEPPLPSLVASSVPRPALLPSMKDILEFWYPPQFHRADLPSVADIVANPWLSLWVQNRQQALHPTFEASYGSGSGTGDAVRVVNETLRLLPSGSYLYISFCPPEEVDLGTGPSDSLMNDEVFFTIDPAAPDYQTELDRVAEKYRSDIYVAGPIETSAVPLRIPDASAFSTKMLGQTLWPPRSGVAGYIERPGEPISVPFEALPYTDGRSWMMATAVSGNEAITGSPIGPDATTWTAPQTLLVVATFAENPDAAAISRLSPLPRAWRAMRIFGAVNQGPMLAISALLLAMGLVASPAAFALERRRITQAMVLEEMGRVQQDAHDKVYNRLSALSKRVELASETISAEVSRSLDGVAEDIRDTVTDLQDILGDARQRTASLTGKDPLRSQLESVAREQAARLDVSVDLTVADELPLLSAQTGWDLQCVLEEAISNAVEHGGATHIDAQVSIDGEELVMRVTDDGSGMSTTDLETLPDENRGLRGMQNRAERHAGTFSAKSDTGGATVEVRVPMPQPPRNPARP